MIKRLLKKRCYNRQIVLGVYSEGYSVTVTAVRYKQAYAMADALRPAYYHWRRG